MAKLQGEASLGQTTVSVAGEAGWRQRWRAWGLNGSETPHRSWQRGRLLVVYEKALFFRAKLHLDAEAWAGHNLDRFSAPAPSRFGGVHIRGIASDRVLPERLGVVRASLSLPLSPTVRGEAGVDAGWVRDIDGVYRARPLSGAGFGLTVPGPWGTLVQGSRRVPDRHPRPPPPDFGAVHPPSSRSPLGRRRRRTSGCVALGGSDAHVASGYAPLLPPRAPCHRPNGGGAATRPKLRRPAYR